MSVQGWKYYNHAMIPTCAPHEEPDLTAIRNGQIWGKTTGGRTPLLARWTTDWDCKTETNWWYCIKDTPIVLEKLPKQARKDIRKGLKNCAVRTITVDQYTDQLYECYCAAWSKYKNADKAMDKDDFTRSCRERKELVYWAAFEAASGKLIGYFSVNEKNGYVEICQAKFHPDYLHIQVSGALYYTVLNYYLEKEGIRYVSSGSRSINHVTNTQEYKEKTFGYRKAYCKLHIKFNPRVRWLMAAIYPLRSITKKFDSHHAVHLLNSVLQMDEIARGSNE